MSFGRQAILVSIIALASIARAASASAEIGSSRNLILFVPEALPSVGIDQTNAPTLARLRLEGVSFENSYSGFPVLTATDPYSFKTDLDLESLISAAAEWYVTAFINDTRASTTQQSATLQAVLNVTLPQFKRGKRPFFLVYRLAEPEVGSTPPEADGTRPAYKPDPRVADSTLEAIETTLRSLGLFDSTNIIVAAERTLSRALKVSNTSKARQPLRREETLGTLPPGFLAVDVTAALQAEDTTINLFDLDDGGARVHWSSNGHPKLGNGVIMEGYDPPRILATIEAHGAYDSIYLGESLSKDERRYAARTILEALFEQDYLGAVFVNEVRVGRFRGALSLSHISPRPIAERLPDIVVAFASVTERCEPALACTSVIANTPLAEGEGVPNSFSRAGTRTFMAARGPDFQRRWISQSPASNADVSRTVARLLNLDIERFSGNAGRVLAESFAGKANRPAPAAMKHVFKSPPSIEGLVTELRLLSLGSSKYFDAAIRTQQIGLAQQDEPRRWRLPRVKSLKISISKDEY